MTDLTLSDDSEHSKEGSVYLEEITNLTEAKPTTNISSGGEVVLNEEDIEHPYDEEIAHLAKAKPTRTNVSSGGEVLDGEDIEFPEDVETAHLTKAKPMTNVSSGGEVLDEEDIEFPNDGETAPLIEAKTATSVSSGGEVLHEEDIEFPDDVELPDDVYSMLFVATRRSFAFWYALFVFFIQLLILGLVAWDLLSDHPDEQDENTLNIPPIVGWPVVTAQSIALMIAVVNQEDITLTLILVSVGLSSAFQEKLPSLQAKYPGGATEFQFWLANYCRGVEGLLVVVVSFFFIVQADNVLDIFLNFAAIGFVSELDNLGHRIAAEGWIGAPIQLIAKKIKDDTLPVKKERYRWTRNVNRILLFVLLLVLYIWWGFIRLGQWSGKILKKNACKTLKIDFGDEVYELPESTWFDPDKDNTISGSSRPVSFDLGTPPNLHYAFFSGKYEVDFDDKAGISGKRPVYHQTSENGKYKKDLTQGMFYYCQSRWVFSIPAFLDTVAIAKETKADLCRNGWLMRSPITEASTLEKAPSDGWQIWTGVLDAASDFSIACVECKTNLDCSVNRGKCSPISQCDCYDGNAGDFCIEDKACDELKFIQDGLIGDDFEKINYVKSSRIAYGRPIYFAAMLGDRFEVLVYTGRRWYDIYFEKEDFTKLLNNNNIHAYWDNLLRNNTRWYSETTDEHTPIGPLKWYARTVSENAGNYGPLGVPTEINQRFECRSVNCDSRWDICGLEGWCASNSTLVDFNGTYGVCKCAPGYEGHFCEYPITR
jgi:hypothetical protein